MLSKESCMVDIPGHSLYMVSNDGRVWSKRANRFIKLHKSSCGYLHVGLHEGGKQKNCYVHRLVAMAFIPNPNSLPQVNHIDEDKTNNSVNNLEWCSARKNVNYGTRNKRASEWFAHHPEFERHRAEMASETCRKPVKNLTTGETFKSVAEASRLTNTCRANIGAACNGRRTTAGGCRWAYTNGGK